MVLSGTPARSCFRSLSEYLPEERPTSQRFLFMFHDDDKTRCSVEVCLPSAGGLLNSLISYPQVYSARQNLNRHERFTQLRGCLWHSTVYDPSSNNHQIYFTCTNELVRQQRWSRCVAAAAAYRSRAKISRNTIREDRAFCGEAETHKTYLGSACTSYLFFSNGPIIIFNEPLIMIMIDLYSTVILITIKVIYRVPWSNVQRGGSTHKLNVER